MYGSQLGEAIFSHEYYIHKIYVSAGRVRRIFAGKICGRPVQGTLCPSPILPISTADRTA